MVDILDGKYKFLSDARLKKLNEIRLIVKKHCPQWFGDGDCVAGNLSQILDNVLAQASATEKARNAFRDELVEKFGYSPNDLRLLIQAREENK